MASRDDNRFSVKPGAPKAGTGAGNGQRFQRFVSQVLKQVSKAGANASGARGARPASTFGRGRVVADMAGRSIQANARRVVIKSRFVVLKKVGANSVSTHLRYIERDGVTRGGERGQAYGSETDSADLKAFEERGKGDRHQFRFIVSVEDAGELQDLRGYTREFMQRMSTDLETPLDWVAVDHWDTDNPHTHIVLRGRAGDGRKGPDLVIAPDYMAYGMRMRASELATEWLGPRTELEIRQSLLQEVEQERLTSLDRALLRQAVLDVLDLTVKPGDRQYQNVLRSRLQVLEGMALAERIDANHWRLGVGMEATLTAMGERGDILRTMHKALMGQQRECVVDERLTSPVIGRIAGKGLADELHDRGYLVVDGIDGRAHYLKLPAGIDLAELPIHGIVEAKSPGQEKAIDLNIAAVAKTGTYKSTEHLAQLKQANDREPQSTAGAHMRRLEALRRAGIVERIADGVWKVPPDILQKAQAHDMQKNSRRVIELLSHLPIDQQVRAIGATWLDKQLVGDGPALADQGFGVQARNAMRGRVDFLAAQGLAEWRGQRAVFGKNLLATLRGRDLTAAGKALEQAGKTYRPVQDGKQASGVYRGSVQLASGRFAVLDDGMTFCLVPWRHVVEQRIGQKMSAIVRGSSASWQFGKQNGISI